DGVTCRARAAASSVPASAMAAMVRADVASMSNMKVILRTLWTLSCTHGANPPSVPAVLPLLSGLAAGLSLIIAIGAQNAYVLRQGLAREHVLLVVAVCIASDVVLIAAGVAGLGALVTHAPEVLTVVRWGGAAFL